MSEVNSECEDLSPKAIERRLVLAVLIRAICDLVTADLESRRSARRWFFSKRAYHRRSFTFINTCEILDIDPSAVKNSLFDAGLFEPNPKAMSSDDVIQLFRIQRRRVQD